MIHVISQWQGVSWYNYEKNEENGWTVNCNLCTITNATKKRDTFKQARV